MVWIHDTGNAQLINGHQLFIPQDATAISGASGAVSYVDGAPIDSGQGVTATIDTARPDWAFFGSSQLPAYVENSAAGHMGLLFNEQIGTGVDLAPLGIRYLGQFDVAVSSDACGVFELPLELASGRDTALFTPFGAEYFVTEKQVLEIIVEAELNDDCAEAIVVGAGTVEFDTRCATSAGPEHPGTDCNPVESDVWFEYTSTCTGELTLSTTLDCSFDTALAVYQSGAVCDPDPTDLLGCSDVPGTCEDVIVDVQVGDTLLIRVGSVNAEEGQGLLSIECEELCPTALACADLDSDDVRDDNCTWEECDAGVCSSTPIGFADLGGPFGACPPDGIVDLNDKFHALLCLANLDTTGAAGYPCSAVNADAGGPFGDCCPDGVCDLHDAMHALNTLQGFSECACPSACPDGPGPDGPVEYVSQADLHLSVRPGLRSGGPVLVDVFLVGSTPNLRAYQLQLSVTGGSYGQLTPLDIEIESRPDWAFVGQLGSFNVSNLSLNLAAVGLDGGGVAVDGMTYLATYAFTPSRGAAGTFLIDVSHGSAEDRTSLIAFPDQAIEIIEVTPAMVTVQGNRRAKSGG
jgi:hypothetical protein